jgi:hypothetical protein
MTGVRDALADYLQVRRRLGFAMAQDGRLLHGFVTFLERPWHSLSCGGSPAWSAAVRLPMRRMWRSPCCVTSLPWSAGSWPGPRYTRLLPNQLTLWLLTLAGMHYVPAALVANLVAVAWRSLSRDG